MRTPQQDLDMPFDSGDDSDVEAALRRMHQVEEERINRASESPGLQVVRSLKAWRQYRKAHGGPRNNRQGAKAA